MAAAIPMIAAQLGAQLLGDLFSGLLQSAQNHKQGVGDGVSFGSPAEQSHKDSNKNLNFGGSPHQLRF